MTPVTGEGRPGGSRRVEGAAIGVHLAAIAAIPWWYGGRSEAIQYGLAAVLLLVTAAWLFTKPPLEIRLVGPAGSLCLWALVQAAGGIASARVSTLESVLVLAAALAVIVFWSTLGRQEKPTRWLATAVIGVAVAQAIFGVAQHAVNPRSLYGVVTEGIASPFGSYRNHNHFAGFVELSALLAAGLALGRAKRGRGIEPATVVLLGLSLLLAGAHVASRSRGGLLALAGGAVVLGPLWRYASGGRDRAGWKSLTVAASLGLVIVGFGWAAVSPSARTHLATLLQGPSDGAGLYRVSTFRSTLRLWSTHPWFGCGLGNFVDALGPFKTANGSLRAIHAESDALEFLAEGGWVGVSLLGWLVVAGLRGFRQRVEEGHDPLRKGIAVGALAATAALFFHSFLDFNLRVPANALVFCALAGVAAAARTPGALVPGPWCRVLAVVVAVIAAAALWRTIGAVQYERAAALESPHHRLVQVSQVLRTHPYLPEAWVLRGTTWWSLARGNPVVTRFRFAQAVSDVEASVRLRPAWSDAWANLGWLRFLVGDTPGARVAFDRALALDPTRMSIGLARADFFSGLGEPDRVVQELIRLHRYNSAEWPLADLVGMAERRYRLDRTRVEKVAAAGARNIK
jgi:O-antigen ligase